MSQSRTSSAIVFRWRAYGESDKIVTVLTEDFGKLIGIAKGARRSRRRFPSSLEPLARICLRFRMRPGASLAFLESAELQRPLESLTEPTRFAYATYLTELADLLTAEEQPVRDLYTLLHEALLVLEQNSATSAFLRAVEMQLLAHAGYDPRIDRCATCGQIPQSEERVFVVPVHGSFYCRGCCPPGQTVIECSGRVLQRLTQLRKANLVDALEGGLGELAVEAAHVTGQLIAAHLSRPLRSIELIRQLTRGPEASLKLDS